MGERIVFVVDVMQPLTTVLVFAAGLVVGLFLNVLRKRSAHDTSK